MNILIVGSSGFIGSHLLTYLKDNSSFTIFTLDRSKQNYIFATSYTYQDLNQIDTIFDIVINLSGESIANKFLNKKRLKQILDSRVLVIKTLNHYFKKHSYPKFYIGASSTDILKDSKLLQDENASFDNSPIANCLKDLETKTMEILKDCPVIITRFAIVLDENGPFNSKLKKLPALNFIDGNNYLPYIELEKVLKALLFICEHNLNVNKKFKYKIYNLASNNFKRAKDLLKEIKSSKFSLPLFKFMLFNVDMRSYLLKRDHKVIAQNLLKEGFRIDN